ncbi:MAG TPA: alpha/beta fold hydrolase [Steroidobacteraceae bacterium]|nr:alpha/beta fold hydrolase [Steroidobacteraceae bacterium]
MSPALALHVERGTTQARGGAPDPHLPPVVMLHGWGMNLRVFDLLRADLAEFETWAIDLPGHGRSPWWGAAAEFEVQQRAVLEVLPPRCVLLGWSFGAKLALAIAAAQPHRVAALVLIAAAPKFAQGADWPHGMATQALRAFDAVLAQDWQRTLQDFIALQLRGSRNAEESRVLIETALATQGAPRREALLAGMALLDSIDLRALAPRITQPVLLIAGQNDRVTPPAAARWLARALRDASLVEVPRAGHAPMVSHHAEVAAAVRGFLLQQLPRSAVDAATGSGR